MILILDGKISEQCDGGAVGFPLRTTFANILCVILKTFYQAIRLQMIC